MKERIIVTGGTGFIASHVVDAYVKEGSVHKPYRKGEIYKIFIDARKAKRVLGWTPCVGFREGIENAIAAYYK